MGIKWLAHDDHDDHDDAAEDDSIEVDHGDGTDDDCDLNANAWMHPLYKSERWEDSCI